MQPDQLVDMNAFAAVVEAKGFTAAALRLGLSKASLSRRVARLEDRLGVRLLNRTTRRLSLTEAGAAFYEGCQRALSEAEAAEAAVTALAAQPSGTLRLSVPMSFGLRHLGEPFARFLERYGGLRLDVVLGDRVVDLVEEGFDAAIRIGRLDDTSLVVRRLCGSRRLVCAAPSYLARAGVPLTPRDLTRHACLHYSYYRGGRSWRFRSDSGEEASVAIDGRLEMNNGDALLAATEAGAGITALPSFILADSLKAGRVLRLLPGWEEAGETGIHLVYPARRNLAPKVRAFLDFLVERFAGTPPWEAALPPPVAQRSR